MEEDSSNRVLGVGARTRPIGRVLRLIIGALFVALVVPYYLGSGGRAILASLGMAMALTLVYALIHLLVSNYSSHLNKWLGAVLAFVPVCLIFFFSEGHGGALGVGETGALTFLAVSLLIAGWRSDPGCEVMALPALIFGRRTHLACLFFSPIDWLEQKLSSRARAAARLRGDDQSSQRL
jgi:hypothetical protein